MLEVPPAKSFGFPGVDELFPSVLMDRLEHPVPSNAPTVLLANQRFVDKVREKVEDSLAFDALAGADGLGRIEVPTPDKNGQSPKENTLGIIEQVVAPVDQGAQCLLAGQDRAAATGEEAESVIESRGHLRDRQNPDAGGRELERKGYAVESAADPDDIGGVLLREGKRRLIGGAAFDEEDDGLVLPEFIERWEAVALGDAQRRHGYQRLPWDVQALAARGKDGQERAGT